MWVAPAWWQGEAVVTVAAVEGSTSRREVRMPYLRWRSSHARCGSCFNRPGWHARAVPVDILVVP
eukprot:12912284-Prorocentrum_lima.AAC.1